MRLKEFVGGAACVALLAGCPPPAEPPPWRSLPEMVSAINANNRRIDFGIKGKGVADVRLTEPTIDASKPPATHRFQLDAITLLVKPWHFFMRLEHSFGQTVIEVGSNDEHYWLWIGGATDTLWWGRRANLNKPCQGSIPIRPDHLIEALGIADLPTDTTGPIGPGPRVTETWNQLLFWRTAADGQTYIDREYWAERHDPFRLREIVHRDADGREQMHTYLDGYAPIVDRDTEGPTPLLARDIRVEWPLEASSIHLTMTRWERLDKLTPDGPTFRFPLDEPDRTFDEVVQVDAECEP